MKIIKAWAGTRIGWANIWIVRECHIEGREKETAFATSAEAQAYRKLVCEAGQTDDVAQRGRLIEQIESTRQHAILTYG